MCLVSFMCLLLLDSVGVFCLLIVMHKPVSLVDMVIAT